MKISGKLLVLCLMLLAGKLVRAQDADTLKFVSATPEKFRQALTSDKNALLIDVREFFEYKKSRIKGAVNIPASGNLEFSSDTLEKNRPLFFYCTSGFRSKRVAKYFGEHGFDKVYSLEGGINEWKKEGREIDRRKIRERR